MNSQDKPIDTNDNLDESLSASEATSGLEQDVVDLWTENNDEEEIVTEFISAETAARK